MSFMLILSIFSFFSGGIQSEQWKHQSNIGTFVIYIFLVSLNVKTNANPKINILMSENIGQRRLNFLWNISMLYIIIKYRNIPEKI